MNQARLPRSYLFVPGNRPERFDKALASGADAVIIDLEDAVPPDQKESARATVSGRLTSSKPVVLRINSVETPWFADDLAICRNPGVAAVMLAKTQRAGDLHAVGAGIALVPLIESAAGFDQLAAIAAVEGVQRLAFGAIDFQLDMNMRGGREELLFFRAQLVLASRLCGLAPPIDSPSTSINEPDEVEAEAQHARRLGFGAKLCIHPMQVKPVNRSFSPDEAEIAWARRVMAISESSNGAAVALDGKMIDKPVILRAERILREQRDS